MKTVIIFTLIFMACNALASYELAKSKMSVSCSSEDNVIIDLNAKRTTLKYTVEGESQGPHRIFKINDNLHDTVTYVSKELVLSLSDQGDKFRYHGDQEWTTGIDCK